MLFFAIGAVSWLTMARVVRGQVLSLRSQPFIEACKAAGLPEWRIFTRHLLPNLIGPITVYATLIVPSAILNESFLSFLGIGIQPPVPTWGSLASEGLAARAEPGQPSLVDAGLPLYAAGGDAAVPELRRRRAARRVRPEARCGEALTAARSARRRPRRLTVLLMQKVKWIFFGVPGVDGGDRRGVRQFGRFSRSSRAPTRTATRTRSTRSTPPTSAGSTRRVIGDVTSAEVADQVFETLYNYDYRQARRTRSSPSSPPSCPRSARTA